MSQGIQRTIFRWIHIVVTIPIYGYIYSPFDKLRQYAPLARFVFFPLMVVSGLWMWKGQVLRQLISKKPAWCDTATKGRKPDMKGVKTKKLSSGQRQELLRALQARFEKNMSRFPLAEAAGYAERS